MKGRTLKESRDISGVGVHTGQKVNVSLQPSETGYIEFIRTDLKDEAFKLDPKKIEAKYSTALKDKGQTVQTLEHLLAVLYMFDISSLYVRLDGEEIPILDGSAAPLVKIIQETGTRELSIERKRIKITKSFRIQKEEAYIDVEPSDDCRIGYTIEYDHPLIRRQSIDLSLNKDVFIKEIAPARTFGFLKDVPLMRSQGLALGGSLENALVLDEKGLINGPLRFQDEFVRHKVLDLLGDLSLLGCSVAGSFRAFKAGHMLHHKLVLFILEHPEYWSLN